MSSNFKISLHISMLSIFLTLFITTMLTIIIVTTVRLYESMVIISDAQMQEVTKSINDKLKSHLQPAELASRITLEMIDSKLIQLNTKEEVLQYTLELLSSLPDAAMVYWGNKNGDFIISRLDSDGTLSSELIKRDGESAISTHLSRDKELNVIKSSETKAVTYDPRTRPWYIAASKVRKTVWSDAYIFFTGDKKTLGITLGTPVYDKKNELLGVFGIDMRLGAVSRFLAQQKIGKTGIAFIVDNNGMLIAHPNLNQLAGDSKDYKNIDITRIGQSNLAKAYTMHTKEGKEKFTFVDKGSTYLATFSLIPSFATHKWYIAVVVPEDDFVGILRQTTTLTLTLSGIIILIGIFLITLFSRKISIQMKNLVHQTDKIKNFDLSESKQIASHITEVSTLAEGISSMRSGLRAFKKYVPADLVRQLISQHQSARLGGEKKKIAILFSDIQNFTSIAESLEPEALMRHLCIYFDHLSRIINDQHGTIDKYIGDAIMAFWGSPHGDAEQSYHACVAALNIMRRLNALNPRWLEQNKPPLPTRIGIHTGLAIVGNLGSSERLNYTAIGDTINIANRLEAINKVYGTNIIISESVKNEVNNHFVFKELDWIKVKGKKESVEIYELISEKSHPDAQQLQRYCDQFSQALQLYRAQEWEQAIDIYTRILTLDPNDSVAALFKDRCEHLKVNPPEKNWGGVWQYTQK